jgi:hypothetical protein
METNSIDKPFLKEKNMKYGKPNTKKINQPAHKAHTEITNIILKTAEPITPLIPMSSFAKNTPIMTVASSGAEDPIKL